MVGVGSAFLPAPNTNACMALHGITSVIKFMAYVIEFFTSNEAEEKILGFESSKLTDKEIAEKFQFVSSLKKLIGAEEFLEQNVFVFPVISSWKKVFLLFLKNWSRYFPKINEVYKLVSDIDEMKFLGISLNQKLGFLEKKKLIFKMKELEGKGNADDMMQKFAESNVALLNIYRPFCYTNTERIRFGEPRRNKRVCRYCGKRMPDTTFKNDSHTISRSLGNIYFFTNDECDACNSKFGKTIEQEFLNYVSLYRTLASGYNGHDYFTTNINNACKIAIDQKTNKIDFKILDRSKIKIYDSIDQVNLDIEGGDINFVDVYRALTKFVIGMLPDDELPKFKETIEWVNGNKRLFLPDVKETIYKEPESHPFINMFFRKGQSDKYPYLVADFNVLQLEFLYVIPGCVEDKFMIEENILDEFLRLRNDQNLWRNLKMNCRQPQSMLLRMNLYRKNSSEP